MRDVQERRRAPSQRHLENINLLLAGGALVIGAVVGLVTLDDLTQFAGAGVRSVAEIAAISSAVLAGLVFLGMLLAHQGRVLPWHGEVHPLRRWFNLAGLTLLIGSLTLFLLRGLGRVAAAAFIGLRLDTYSGATFIAATCALSVYFAAGIAGRLNTESLSVLVSAFLVLGAMMSAVNASDQEWWRVHFSALGMTPDLSGFAFNFTLVLTGIVVITLADFLTHDMRSWLERTRQRAWKAFVLRAGLMLMGAMLAGVGLIPVTVSHRGHLFVTYGAVGAFVVLAVVAPLILRGIPWGFRVVSVGALGFVAWLWYLHREIRYLGTTGFEMIAVATVLLWMVLFIRTVVAAGRDLQEEPDDTLVLDVSAEDATDHRTEEPPA